MGREKREKEEAKGRERDKKLGGRKREENQFHIIFIPSKSPSIKVQNTPK
jgi:hypothetical protein